MLTMCLCNFFKIISSDHSFNKYAKFSKKLILPTLWYSHVRVRIRGKKCKYFRKFYVSTKWMIPFWNLFFNKRRIWDPIIYLWWKFYAKIVNSNINIKREIPIQLFSVNLVKIFAKYYFWEGFSFAGAGKNSKHFRQPCQIWDDLFRKRLPSGFLWFSLLYLFEIFLRL